MQSMFGESTNMNHKNRHLAFWNIRVVVVRLRVRTYEVVACYFGKIEQAFSQDLNNQIMDLVCDFSKTRANV